MWVQAAAQVGLAAVKAFGKKSKTGESPAAAAYRQARGDAQKAIDFGQNLLRDYNAVYGTNLDNLRDYYNKLSPEGLASREATLIEDQFQKFEEESLRELDELQDPNVVSGLKISTSNKIKFEKALKKIESASTADERVAGQRFEFQKFGEQQRQDATRVTASANQSLVNVSQQAIASLPKQGKTTKTGLGKALDFLGDATGGSNPLGTFLGGPSPNIDGGYSGT